MNNIKSKKQGKNNKHKQPQKNSVKQSKAPANHDQMNLVVKDEDVNQIKAYSSKDKQLQEESKEIFIEAKKELTSEVKLKSEKENDTQDQSDSKQENETHLINQDQILEGNLESTINVQVTEPDAQDSQKQILSQNEPFDQNYYMKTFNEFNKLIHQTDNSSQDKSNEELEGMRILQQCNQVKIQTSSDNKISAQESQTTSQLTDNLQRVLDTADNQNIFNEFNKALSTPVKVVQSSHKFCIKQKMIVVPKESKENGKILHETTESDQDDSELKDIHVSAKSNQSSSDNNSQGILENGHQKSQNLRSQDGQNGKVEAHLKDLSKSSFQQCDSKSQDHEEESKAMVEPIQQINANTEQSLGNDTQDRDQNEQIQPPIQNITSKIIQEMEITTIDEVKGDESSANDIADTNEQELDEKTQQVEARGSQGDQNIEEQNIQQALEQIDKLNKSEFFTKGKSVQSQVQDAPIYEQVGQHLKDKSESSQTPKSIDIQAENNAQFIQLQTSERQDSNDHMQRTNSEGLGTLKNPLELVQNPEQQIRASQKERTNEKQQIRPTTSLNKSLDQIHIKEEKKQEALGDQLPINHKFKSTLSLSEVKLNKCQTIQDSGKKSQKKDTKVLLTDEDDAQPIFKLSLQKDSAIQDQKSHNQNDGDELADNSAEDSEDNTVPQKVRIEKQKKQKYFRKKTYTNINSSSIDDGHLESANHHSIHNHGTNFHSMIKLTSSEDEAQKGMKFTTSKEREKRCDEKKVKTPDKPNEVSQHQVSQDVSYNDVSSMNQVKNQLGRFNFNVKSDVIEDKKVVQRNNSKEIGGVEVGCKPEHPQDAGEGLDQEDSEQEISSCSRNYNSDHESRGDFSNCSDKNMIHDIQIQVPNTLALYEKSPKREPSKSMDFKNANKWIKSQRQQGIPEIEESKLQPEPYAKGQRTSNTMVFTMESKLFKNDKSMKLSLPNLTALMSSDEQAKIQKKQKNLKKRKSILNVIQNNEAKHIQDSEDVLQKEFKILDIVGGKEQRNQYYDQAHATSNNSSDNILDQAMQNRQENEGPNMVQQSMKELRAQGGKILKEQEELNPKDSIQLDTKVEFDKIQVKEEIKHEARSKSMPKVHSSQSSPGDSHRVPLDVDASNQNNFVKIKQEEAKNAHQSFSKSLKFKQNSVQDKKKQIKISPAVKGQSKDLMIETDENQGIIPVKEAAKNDKQVSKGKSQSQIQDPLNHRKEKTDSNQDQISKDLMPAAKKQELPFGGSKTDGQLSYKELAGEISGSHYLGLRADKRYSNESNSNQHKSIPKNNNGNDLNSIEEIQNCEDNKLDPTLGYDVDSGDDQIDAEDESDRKQNFKKNRRS